AKKGGILEKGNAVQRQCVCKKVEVGLLGMNLTEPWSSEKNCAESIVRNPRFMSEIAPRDSDGIVRQCL
ncbi:MAG: hypothetical protein EB071_11995, partial [Gammaproteobacteria bacterium]|nr:hypothetical protein [Gammaproteobacteria bacterium]